jgi:hypothetical protein
MNARYRYATCLAWGGDVPTAEVEVEVSYGVAWGSPETGAGYMADPYNYDPGSPDVVEDIRLELVEGKPRPWGMYHGFVANEDDEFEFEVIEKLEDHEAAMLEEARAREAAWAE